MRVWLVICVAAVMAVAAGCSDRQAAALEQVKRAVCACQTSDCAEAALKAVPQGAIKATHRAQRVARDMLDCLAKLYAAERPAPAE